MRWSWDPRKNRINRQKHGLDFDLAIRVFADPDALTELDRIEDGEERWRTLGLIDGVMVVLVAHTYRDNAEAQEIIRVISARRATSHERKHYEQEKRRNF